MSDPKRRTIAAAPFADRVVHHALCNLVAPVLERRFIARSFSCQMGKGTTAARECVRKLVNTHRWVLKCDVRKFFDSINHDILLKKLAGVIACAGTLDLCRGILASYDWRSAQVPVRNHPMPDRTEDGADHTACGLPIGNLTSQLWGNFFMDGMDHWITEEERQGAYARYTDDFLLFSDSKERLAALHAGITAHLATLQLKLAVPQSRLLACAEGVPFCGFRFLPGQSPWVLGATKHRFEARRSRLKKAGDTHALSLSTFAWYQFSREGNTEGLLRAYARSKCRPHGISWPRLRDCQHPRRMVEVPCGTLCQP